MLKTIRALPFALLLFASRAVPAAPDKKPNPTVYVTRTGKRYHRATCSSLAHSKIPMKLKAAKEAGYTPCLRCQPPE